MPDLDPETRAIGEIAALVNALEEDQRGRVIRYIVDRFKIDGAPLAPTRPDTGETATEQENQRSFEDLATLFDACNPNTDSLRLWWVPTGFRFARAIRGLMASP